MSVAIGSYVAIGDSFTEGVGDELSGGRVRGWADLVALGLAVASKHPVTYANLAIRGRLLQPIIDTQLDAALELRPKLISLNGGGNDILRPRVSIAGIADQIEAAVHRIASTDTKVLLLSGANPTRHLPLGAFIESRGNQLAQAIGDRLPIRDVTFVDNWADAELTDIRYWSADKLHLNTRGHARVASNVLVALGHPPVDGSSLGDEVAVQSQRSADYYRQYVLPWIGRRLTGRSSGDNREPKIATLQLVEPSNWEH